MPTNPQPQPDAEGRIASALECSRAGLFVCVHGDHEVEAADLRALLASLATLREENAKMVAAINWACGAGDSDFAEPENANRYWWRRDLHGKAGLEYDRGTCKYVPRAALAPQGRTDDAQPARLGGTAH